MALENKVFTPISSAEDVQRICYSDSGRARYQEKYPSLAPEEIDRVLDEMKPLVESATIFTFIPSLLEGSLQVARLAKEQK